MSKLIPTPVVDKNGKLTTVHKKASAAPSGRKLGGIAPTLGNTPAKPSVTKEYKPTQAQLKPEGHGFGVYGNEIDTPLFQYLVHGAHTRQINIRLSDVDLYAVLGNIKDTPNALALISAKDGVPDAAYLEELSLTHLENTSESRKEMMRTALERRIPAKDFIEFERKYRGYKDDPTFMDAAQTYSIPSFTKVKGLVDEVRRGTVSFDDLMVVGPKTINNLRRYGEDVISIMKKLRDGTANYTADQLREIFLKCTQNKEVNVMFDLMTKYGGEYATTIQDPSLAHDITLACDWDKQEHKPAVTYADNFRQQTFRNHKQVYDLFRAGVDLDFAVEHSKSFEAHSVQQIIALHEGISKPISGGWL
jgi:hypothetical protein